MSQDERKVNDIGCLSDACSEDLSSHMDEMCEMDELMGELEDDESVDCNDLMYMAGLGKSNNRAASRYRATECGYDVDDFGDADFV